MRKLESIEAQNSRKDYKIGIICVIACQLLWGFLPIYWHYLKPIDSMIIILYRILTMFIFAFAGALAKHSIKEIFEPWKDIKVLGRNFLAGLILTVNWSIYIWAINSGRVIQTSIGYYIEPIVICVFGIIVFKEKLTKYNLAAIILACVAVLIILLYYMQIPGVALGLAFTWMFYSALKKTSRQPVLIALVNETALYAIIALALIIYLEINGIGAIATQGVSVKYFMMFLGGLVTVVPVGLFAVSAKKVSLLIIGLTQYISPTITLICGIYLFGEKVEIAQVVAFIIIWIGLVIFSFGEWKTARENK